jgi:hypothetical protein
MSEYLIRLEEIGEDSKVVMQLEDQEPIVDIWSIPNINQIIMNSYNSDA